MKHIRRGLNLLERLLRRIFRARKRMKLTAVCALLLSLGTSAHIFSTAWVYPNTYVNGTSLAYTRATAIESYRKKLLTTPFRMRIQHREYPYTYTDFGVEIDADLLFDEILEPNKRPFPYNLLALLQALHHPRYIHTPLVFTQEFDRFIDRTVYDFSEATDEVAFNQEQKDLTVVANEEKYRIDSEAFKQLLISRITQPHIPLYPKLVKVKNEQVEALENRAERIKQMFLTPLTVYVDAGGTTKSFVLTERELADISTVTWENPTSDGFVDIHGELALRTINEHVKKIRLQVKGNVVSPKVIKDLEDALISRFNGRSVDAIKLSYDKGPNSDGLLATKYIEVDISQQKMYTFANGKLKKEYRVSTGLDYPTPVGEFTILNKIGLGFSAIYNVWMPWWMGFKYSDELQAYFGIHELPYALTDGSLVRRPAGNIGTPSTGGCVALSVGDAQEVYRFADIGTKVVIYH